MKQNEVCINLRDVGEFINLLNGRNLLPVGKLYRSGKIDAVSSATVICSPGTIINLRNSTDQNHFGAKYYHFPTSSDLEKYETNRPEVRQWLQQVVKVFEDPALAFPVLIHCNSGKDRTGVVVAALLKIVGIPDELIIQEYLLSDGDVRETWIRQALSGFGNVKKYFQRISFEQIQMRLPISNGNR